MPLKRHVEGIAVLHGAQGPLPPPTLVLPGSAEFLFRFVPLREQAGPGADAPVNPDNRDGHLAVGELALLVSEPSSPRGQGASAFFSQPPPPGPASPVCPEGETGSL